MQSPSTATNDTYLAEYSCGKKIVYPNSQDPATVCPDCGGALAESYACDELPAAESMGCDR